MALRVFFVQSGFLITSLLLSEWRKTGTIDLRRFYIRRAYRILPAAYAYLLGAVIVFGFTLGGSHLLSALTYTNNYDMSRPWPLGHLWSLAVEEQFYILWPAVLLLFFARRARILLGVVILTPLLNFCLLYLGWKFAVGNWFPTVADSLATGCLLAILRPKLDQLAFLRSRWMLAVGVLVATLGTIPINGRVPGALFTAFGWPALHIGIAAFLYHAIHARYSWLNFALIVYLGTVSYSVYLWQQLFLNRYSVHVWTAFPQNLAFAVLLGLASYYTVERRFVDLREKRRARRSEPLADTNAAIASAPGLQA